MLYWTVYGYWSVLYWTVYGYSSVLYWTVYGYWSVLYWTVYGYWLVLYWTVYQYYIQLCGNCLVLYCKLAHLKDCSIKTGQYHAGLSIEASLISCLHCFSFIFHNLLDSFYFNSLEMHSHFVNYLRQSVCDILENVGFFCGIQSQFPCLLCSILEIIFYLSINLHNGKLRCN